MFRRYIVTVCACSSMFLVCGVASAVVYHLTDVGSLGIGGTSVIANAVAVVGGQPMVVGQDMGSSGTTTTMQAFAWTQSSGMVNLQTLLKAKYGSSNVAYSQANGLNAAGQVVGLWSDSSSSNHAFLYAGGSIVDITSTPGGIQGVAGINAGGQFAGSYAPGLTSLGFITTATQPSWTDVSSYGGGVNSGLVLAINNSGWLGGTGYGTTTQAAEYNGSWFLLPQLVAGNHQGRIWGMDNSGNSVGYQAISGTTGGRTAFYYNYSGNTVTNLGYVTGDTTSQARAINDSGTIVGLSGSRAMVSGTTAGTMQDLNGAAFYTDGSHTNWNLTVAYGIDNSGDIVGAGTLSGVAHAFLLTPVTAPEPSTLLLAAIGIAGVSAFSRLRRRK
jgi:probable HAF family extracellular repeat protein